MHGWIVVFCWLDGFGLRRLCLDILEEACLMCCWVQLPPSACFCPAWLVELSGTAELCRLVWAGCAVRAGWVGQLSQLGGLVVRVSLVVCCATG